MLFKHLKRSKSDFPPNHNRQAPTVGKNLKRSKSVPQPNQLLQEVTTDTDIATAAMGGKPSWNHNRVSICNQAYDFLLKDPLYLLRLCQESRWSSAEKCCKILIRIFLLEDNSSSYSSSIHHLQWKARDQLFQTDNWGNTPLHVTCYYKPPPSVVKALLKAAKRAPPDVCKRERGISAIYTMTNEKGETPLIIACKSGACRMTINLVMHVDAISMCDNGGASAFLGLLNRYTTIQRISDLNNRYIGLENIVSKRQLVATKIRRGGADDGGEDNGCSEDLSLKNDYRLMEMLSDSLDVSGANLSASSPRAFPLFWSIVDDLMRTAWAYPSLPASLKLRRESFVSHLHGAAFVADALPREIADMILRIHGRSGSGAAVTVAEHDDKQAEGPSSPLELSLMRQVGCHSKPREQHAYFVKRLVELNPAAVKRCGSPAVSSSQQRRSIFCQAIVTGNYWSLQDGSDGPVQALFRHCPDEIRQRDGETRLYPFMLAASAVTMITTTSTKGGTSLHQHDSLGLNTIYSLLRTAPELIMQR